MKRVLKAREPHWLVYPECKEVADPDCPDCLGYGGWWEFEQRVTCCCQREYSEYGYVECHCTRWPE